MMTDNEIIKALEYHRTTMENHCDECPYKGRLCSIALSSDALDLINRQKTEIETLKTNNNSLCITLHNRARVERTEAIKEFAEKLEDLSTERLLYEGYGETKLENIILCTDIDNLVKEMMENITKIEHNSLCETETYKGGE